MSNRSMTPEELSDRLVDFGARVGKVVDAIPETRLGRHLAGQLVRCGTSPALNYDEACAAESRADFIHKVNISLKEMRESRACLRLIIRSELLPQERLSALFDECTQLCNILGQSIITTKQNLEKNQ